MPRSAPGAAMRWPSSSTSPEVGWSRPATMRKSVLLPQPEGPRMVTKSFSATCRSVASSACVLSKRRETPRTCRMAEGDNVVVIAAGGAAIASQRRHRDADVAVEHAGGRVELGVDRVVLEERTRVELQPARRQPAAQHALPRRVDVVDRSLEAR